MSFFEVMLKAAEGMAGKVRKDREVTLLCPRSPGNLVRRGTLSADPLGVPVLSAFRVPAANLSVLWLVASSSHSKALACFHSPVWSGWFLDALLVPEP